MHQLTHIGLDADKDGTSSPCRSGPLNQMPTSGRKSQ